MSMLILSEDVYHDNNSASKKGKFLETEMEKKSFSATYSRTVLFMHYQLVHSTGIQRHPSNVKSKSDDEWNR